MAEAAKHVSAEMVHNAFVKGVRGTRYRDKAFGDYLTMIRKTDHYKIFLHELEERRQQQTVRISSTSKKRILGISHTGARKLSAAIHPYVWHAHLLAFPPPMFSVRERAAELIKLCPESRV